MDDFLNAWGSSEALQANLARKPGTPIGSPDPRETTQHNTSQQTSVAASCASPRSLRLSRCQSILQRSSAASSAERQRKRAKRKAYRQLAETAQSAKKSKPARPAAAPARPQHPRKAVIPNITHLNSTQSSPPSRLIGREFEKEQLKAFLNDRKPVVVYGPPGVGKTFLVHKTLQALHLKPMTPNTDTIGGWQGLLQWLKTNAFSVKNLREESLCIVCDELDVLEWTGTNAMSRDGSAAAQRKQRKQAAQHFGLAFEALLQCYHCEPNARKPPIVFIANSIVTPVLQYLTKHCVTKEHNFATSFIPPLAAEHCMEVLRSKFSHEQRQMYLPETQQRIVVAEAVGDVRRVIQQATFIVQGKGARGHDETSAYNDSNDASAIAARFMKQAAGSPFRMGLLLFRYRTVSSNLAYELLDGEDHMMQDLLWHNVYNKPRPCRMLAKRKAEQEELEMLQRHADITEWQSFVNTTYQGTYNDTMVARTFAAVTVTKIHQLRKRQESWQRVLRFDADYDVEFTKKQIAPDLHDRRTEVYVGSQCLRERLLFQQKIGIATPATKQEYWLHPSEAVQVNKLRGKCVLALQQLPCHTTPAAAHQALRQVLNDSSAAFTLHGALASATDTSAHTRSFYPVALQRQQTPNHQKHQKQQQQVTQSDHPTIVTQNVPRILTLRELQDLCCTVHYIHTVLTEMASTRSSLSATDHQRDQKQRAAMLKDLTAHYPVSVMCSIACPKVPHGGSEHNTGLQGEPMSSAAIHARRLRDAFKDTSTIY